MNKEKKNALKYGVGANYEPLEYRCPKCNALTPLGAKRCTNCHTKRPKDAYERSLSLQAEETQRREALKRPVKQPVPGTVCKMPLPKQLCYASADAPVGCYVHPAPSVASCYASPAMQKMAIPKFYSTDEYGRVFEMPVSYGPLGIGGPVPVPIPSKAGQTSPIDIPLNIKV